MPESPRQAAVGGPPPPIPPARPRTAALRTIPALVLMGLIFVLSAQSDLDSGLGVVDDVGRKFVHAGTYALLAFLVARGLDPLRLPRRQLLAGAALLALLYAISDEWHQSFVEGRVGSPIDVAIDAVGIGLFLAAYRRSGRVREAVGAPLVELPELMVRRSADDAGRAVAANRKRE